MSGTMLLEAASAVALLGVGGLTGWIARGRREDTLQQAETQRQELERQRIIHDTKRVSIARPGTRPGRVSRASIDMGASNMHQHGREVE